MASSNMGLVAAVFILQGLFLCGLGQTRPPPPENWRPPPRPSYYQLGEYTTFHTTGSSETSGWIRYTVTQHSGFTFDVKTCMSAYIRLVDTLDYEDLDQVPVVIALGVEKNTKSSIKYGANYYEVFDTPGILQCSEFRRFWIDWFRGNIRVGVGSIYGENILMEYGIDFGRPGRGKTLNVVEITTQDASTGVWRVQENSGEELYVHTKQTGVYRGMWKSVEDRVFFHFSVKACRDVRLILTSQYASTNGKVYEVVIGSKEDSKTFIRVEKDGDDNTIKARSSDKQLDCIAFRDFWIGWLDGKVMLGTGEIYSGGVSILSWQDSSPIDVRHLAILSQDKAEWIFADTLQEKTELVTPTNSDPFSNIWIDIPTFQFLTIAVKACEEAVVYMSNKKEMDAEFAFEVVFGDAGNTISGIRRPVGEGYLVQGETPNVLDCLEMRRFWISWRAGKVRVGRGRIYGYYPLFDALDYPRESPIQSVALSTPKSIGTWQIPEIAGEELQIKTPANYTTYGRLWRVVPTREFIKFQVKTCSSAHIALAVTPGILPDQRYIEVVIGMKNGSSAIYSRQGDKKKWLSGYFDSDILSCEEFREFYISWEEDAIEMGTGGIPGNKMKMGYWNPLNHKVRAVSFLTHDEHPGEWLLPEDTGDQLLSHTESHKAWNDRLILNSDMTWTTFSVMSCRDSFITLATSPNDIELGAVEIGIGVEYNKKSTLTQLSSTTRPSKPDLTKDTPGILSCTSSRTFWISWKNGEIEFGEGPVYRYRPAILYWQYKGVFNPQLLSYSTSSSSSAYWWWKENMALGIEFDVGPYSTAVTSVTLQHRQYLVFHVLACYDVMVSLHAKFGIFEDLQYDIILGESTTNESFIRHYSAEGSVQLTKRYTPGILKCNNFTTFWITWQNGVIRLGSGTDVGMDTILDYQEVIPVDIDIATFGAYSSFGTRGEWYLPLLEDYFIPRPTNPPPTQPPPGGLSGGAIAGIVIGVILGCILITAVVMTVLNRRGVIEVDILSIPFQVFSNEEIPETPVMTGDQNFQA